LNHSKSIVKTTPQNYNKSSLVLQRPSLKSVKLLNNEVDSEGCVQFALSTAVNLSHHPAEVLHAHVQAGRLPKHAVVKLCLITLGVVRCVTDRLAVLLFGVAAPHSIDGLLTCQEVVSVLQQHARMTDINADLVVLAGAVAVTQQSDLFSVGDDALDLNADFMFGTFFFLIVQRVINHFVVKTCRGLK
jgi:hypothetical protein